LTDEDDHPDATVELAIKTWQSFIERATRQWFSPIEMEFYFDGNGTNTVMLGVPIIAISELRINGSEEALNVSYWRAYANRGGQPDDRRNPRIKLYEGSQPRDIFTAPIRNGRLVFQTGVQNQYVRGVFGFVEQDGSTPELICRALLKLVIEKLTAPLVLNTAAAPSLVAPPILSGIVHEEWTDGHKIKYQHKGGDLKPRAPGLYGITDDPEILNIIKLYKAPIGVATQSSPSYV
jgi:hypothetical protein